MIRRKLLPLLLISFLTSCSTEKKEELTEPNILYQDALSALNKDQYALAVEKFEQLQREHPSTELAGQAHVKAAYALYLEGKFFEAVVMIDDFIKQYPAHQITPYMFYLKGLCYYDQILDVGRDQELSHKAISAFTDLITRFPNSKYSRDAQLKIEYAYNLLAGQEMDIARFYLNKGELIAALNRFKYVVDYYQTSIFITESLYRLAEIYYTLGDVDQAKNYASVLGYNYPDNEWYAKAYKLIHGNENEIVMPWYKKVTKNIW